MSVFFRKPYIGKSGKAGKPGRWMVEFEMGGRRIVAPAMDPATGQPATSRRRAEQAENAMKVAEQKRQAAEAKGARAIRGSGITWAQLAEYYLGTLEGAHRKNGMAYAAEIVAHYGPSAVVSAIDALAIQQYREACAAQPVRVWKGGRRDPADPRFAHYWQSTGKRRSAGTCNRYLDALSKMLRLAHEWIDAATGEPVLKYRPKIQAYTEPEEAPTPLVDAELEAIVGQARPHVAEALELMRLTGLRRTEALSAERGWLDRERGGINVPGALAKNRKARFQPVGEAGMEFLEALDRQAQLRGVTHLVTWPGQADDARLASGKAVDVIAWRPVASIARAFRGARARAGLADGKRRRIHDVRARYITEVARVAPGRAAQRAADHADPKTTARYIGFASSEIAGWVRQAEQARTPPRRPAPVLVASRETSGAPAGDPGPKSQQKVPTEPRTPLKIVD